MRSESPARLRRRIRAGYRQAEVAFAAGDAGFVEVFAEGDRVFAGRAEQVAYLRDGEAVAGGQPVQDTAATGSGTSAVCRVT